MKFVSLCSGPQREFGPRWIGPIGSGYTLRWIGKELYALDEEGQVHALVTEVGKDKLHWLPLQVASLPSDWRWDEDAK